MLKSLMLRAVGPAPQMALDLADRINVITGDNGLGKSFLLDVAWWALTKTWAGTPALPTDSTMGEIRYVVSDSSAPTTSFYSPEAQSWSVTRSAAERPGVIIYMRIDDGFSVWDPARKRPYHFDHREVWDGLRIDGVSVSEGLERDWVSWQKGRELQFALLEIVLQKLSPPDIPLKPGPPKRVFLGEGFDRPTLIIGENIVPVAIASAGIRRILALAYLLVWAWHEHRVASLLIGHPPDPRMVLLIDEPETHLHPAWQRRVIPAIVEAIDVLHEEHESPTQILMATHAPLVLASLEPFFDAGRDALFHLRFVEGHAVVECTTWAKQGDASQWLVSEVFGLEQARSAEAEQAIEAAEAFMRGDDHLPANLGTRAEIHRRLQELLPPHDPFWARWLTRTEATLRASS